MIWPPVHRIVVKAPVAVLDPRHTSNRQARRRSHFGRLGTWDKMAGVMSPKQMRESGL